jgi:hypothetical protein
MRWVKGRDLSLVNLDMPWELFKFCFGFFFWGRGARGSFFRRIL